METTCSSPLFWFKAGFFCRSGVRADEVQINFLFGEIIFSPTPKKLGAGSERDLPPPLPRSDKKKLCVQDLGNFHSPKTNSGDQNKPLTDFSKSAYSLLYNDSPLVFPIPIKFNVPNHI